MTTPLRPGIRQPAGKAVWFCALTHGAVVGTLVLLCVLLINQATASVRFGVLGKHRRQPVAWFLAGALTAGWAGYLLIDHPSVSESYFIHTAIPFGLAAAGWLAATIVRDLGPHQGTFGGHCARARHDLRWVAAGGRCEAGLTQRHQLLLVARPLLVILVLAGLWWLLRRRPGAGRSSYWRC